MLNLERRWRAAHDADRLWYLCAQGNSREKPTVSALSPPSKQGVSQQELLGSVGGGSTWLAYFLLPWPQPAASTISKEVSPARPGDQTTFRMLAAGSCTTRPKAGTRQGFLLLGPVSPPRPRPRPSIRVRRGPRLPFSSWIFALGGFFCRGLPQLLAAQEPGWEWDRPRAGRVVVDEARANWAVPAPGPWRCPCPQGLPHVRSRWREACRLGCSP